MAIICRHRYILHLLFVLPLLCYCYEKTLRKMVRNQSKMIQQPFSVSDNVHGSMAWRNKTLVQGNEVFIHPGYSQVKTFMHRVQFPKISTILSSMDSHSKATYSKTKLSNAGNIGSLEFRLSKNSLKNLTMALSPTTEESYRFYPPRHTNNSHETAAGAYYEIPQRPTAAQFFPSSNDGDLQSVEQKPFSKDALVIPPNPKNDKESKSPVLKGMFIGDTKHNRSSHTVKDSKNNGVLKAESDDKVDYLIQENAPVVAPAYNYSVNVNPYVCVAIQKVQSDIDAQTKFIGLDIEPQWMFKNQFWDHIFESRYEYLMRSSSWPSLHVILMPSTHVDSIWKRSFEHYHVNSVKKILSNVVKKLHFYTNFTFTWHEVSHLSQWWKKTTPRNRSIFRKLLKSGRLEITTGGWVETEESTSHLFGLVHQLIEGHQWLKRHLNYSPKVGWSSNSVTHSPTFVYLLSASGISYHVITNLHYSWEQYFAEFQYSDFIWLQDWDSDINIQTNLNKHLNRIGNERYPKHAVLTHILQFNADNYEGCGPNKNICTKNFDFSKFYENIEVHSYNIKQKAELLLEQYSKTGTLTPHNVLIASLGGRYRYESQVEFDYQYNNYQRLADFVNINSNIYKANIEFGTPTDYFNTILKKHKKYQKLKGDFSNFADIKTGTPAYWTGFFTTRPMLKILLRRIESTLRTTEIMLAFATNFNVLPHYNSTNLFNILVKARETVARLQDRHVVGGTLNIMSLQYVYKNILSTVKGCWYIQEVVASLLTMKQNLTNPVPYLKKLVYREGEYTNVFKTVSPGDQIFVLNSLGQERTEIVEMVTKQPNIRIVDYNRKEITIQISPMWTYNSDGLIKISSTFFKISFYIVVPPMTLELYRIKDTYDATSNAATVYCSNCIVDGEGGPATVLPFPFIIQPVQPGDVQLESYKHRIIIDEITGFLKTVLEKETNIEKPVIIDYGAFKSSDVNAGMFLFNTNITKPLHDILSPYRIGLKTKVAIIIAGIVTSEMTTIYGHLLQHTIKLFNLMSTPLANAISIESKVDFEASPKNRELELFISIKSDINNDNNNPEIYIDNNGFQYTPHLLNISNRIESNIYPMTSMSFIQDHRSRMTILTDHAQAVTALQEGHLLIMLDRRVLFNDGRGTHEGLADSSPTYHRHFLLLENFVDSANKYSNLELKLPSFTANRLAKFLDNNPDIFLVDKKFVDHTHYAFLPLIKASFPCDVSVINFRVIVNKSLQPFAPTAALLVLYRQGVTCRIDDSALLNCNGETSFDVENILRHTKAVLHTNLVGTSEGMPINTINNENFPALELMTLKIYF
ncbi:hypothetical protein evm_002195 [Chilo suppressalis]|nr:hypothetical protein evm_002195 [Chilo suppressalis]